LWSDDMIYEKHKDEVFIRILINNCGSASEVKSAPEDSVWNKSFWSTVDQLLMYRFWSVASDGFQKLSPVASDIVQKQSLVTNLVSLLTKVVILLEEFVTTSCCIYTHSYYVNNVIQVTQVWIKIS